METRGRKKSVAKPAPPARDPRNVETIEILQQRIQELKLQQLRSDLPIEKAKIKPNILDDEPVDVNPFGRENPRYVNHLYQPRRKDHVVNRDDRYRDDPIRSLRLKIEIPEFTGKVHSEDFIDWLSTVEQFDKLFMRCDVVEEKEQVVAQFLGVLKLEIADIIKTKNNGSTTRFTSHFNQPTKTASPIAPKTAPKATTPTTLITGLIYDTDTEPELDEPGDELVYPDREEALVIQRVLQVAVLKSIDDNLWLRNNISRTKCTSKGKIVI
uniref:Reverse transcriptase domain-containing protein n=1 Tax=Tanacetum cinerariifolium TaxID=118510 RepID=A0A6L2N2L0_TANCI|nr:hypothetical protein [Tanacetum cinerariifolium]